MGRFLVLFCFVLLALPGRIAAAQEVDGTALMDALIARTPGATLHRMRERPNAFEREAAGLILGYGGADGVSATEIENAILAEAARLRARELRRLLEADLDGDLTVTTPELNVLIQAASATMRGRLVVWHRTADRDRDGVARWGELRQHAQAVAEQSFDAQARAAMRAMMVFDLDDNGRVEMAEVLDAMEMLGAPG